MNLQDGREKRRPNQSERRALAAAEVAAFVNHYSRPQKGGGKGYDRKLLGRLRRMDPQRLDALMREDEE